MNGPCSFCLPLRAALGSLLIALCTSCALVTKLPSGPIIVAGEVNNATGLPLPNTTMRLFRGLEYLETKTGVNGAYAFPSLAPDSYRLRPRLEDCEFLPDDVDLDRVTSNVTQNFGGFGPGCGGPPTVNMGATSGPLTISGHIRDASGQAIVGARVDLRPDFGDDTRGIRFTDLTGGYSFRAKKGDYKLRASGACSFAPERVDKDDVKASVVQDFTAGPGCVTASKSNTTATGSVLTVRQAGVVLGTTYVHLEQRSVPGDALARLAEIAAEQPASSLSLTIAGNPAIERQALVKLPGPELDIAGYSGPEFGPFLALTTAIAVGGTVVRFESQLSGNADPATIALFLQVARNFTPAAMPDLHGPAPIPVPMTHNAPPGPAPVATGITAPGLLAPGTFGEVELIASDTANAIVYGTQSGPFVSTNGGQTVQAATYNTAPAPPNATFISSGDPTVAVGSPNAAFKQNIYFAQLQTAAPIPAGGTRPIVAIGLYQSTNDGQTFNLNSFPVNCNNAAAACVIPDQEHVIADRVNRAVTPAGNFDQLYLTWRNFTTQNNNAHTIAVACSRDGGANWTTDLTTLVSTGGDFPRLSVGPDGSLLVAYSVISSATYALTVQKFTSCANGFQPTVNGQVIKPVTVIKSVTEVTDMPGVDRQVQGNYSAAFDDSDGSAQTVFMVYSNEASAGNDDIRIVESRDGGSNWTRDSIVSTNGNGRKYFPWVCSTVGKKFVTWYDRRGSSAANPDLTAYFRSSVFDNGSASAVGIGPEFNVSGVNDPQCAPGFFGGVRGAVEQTQCNNLPAGFIQGGTCQATCAAGAVPPCGSANACDFRASPACAAPLETCTPGGGIPKYGDYNGAACALGTLFVAWASATPPKGAVCIVNGLPSATAAKCCSGIRSGGTCAPSVAACTANGGACGPGLQACCSSGATGQCQAGTCMPVIAMYTGSSCIGPGCAGLPVTITYHQTGACNGYVNSFGGHFVGPNSAYVFFGIEEIDNSQGSASFAFDPAKLYVQQATQDHVDPTLSVYAAIFGPFAAVPTTLTAGQDLKFGVVGRAALVVTTTNPDGAVEANQTPYFLRYNRAPTDPQITLVKSDATRISWPLTQDCKTIVLN